MKTFRLTVLAIVLCLVRPLGAQSEKSEVFFKNGTRTEVLIKKVQKRCLITNEKQLISLKTVDSVRTADQSIVSAILAEPIQNIGLSTREHVLLVDFTRAYFPVQVSKQEWQPPLYRRAVSFAVSSERLGRFGLSLEHSPVSLRGLLLRSSFGAGIYSKQMLYDAWPEDVYEKTSFIGYSVGQGAGINLDLATIRFAVLANFVWRLGEYGVKQYRSTFSYGAWFTSGDVALQNSHSRLQLVFGTKYWLTKEIRPDGEKPEWSYWIGLGWKLDQSIRPTSRDVGK